MAMGFKSKASQTKRYFITGISVILPLWLTVYILWLLVKITGNMLFPALRPMLRGVFQGPVPESVWLFVCATLVCGIVWMTGFLTLEIIGHGHWETIDSLLARVPLVRSIHLTLRRLTNLFVAPKKKFERVALVEFPLPGQYTVGFLTREAPVLVAGTPHELVLVPTAPNPTSGFLLFVPQSKIQFADMDVDAAMEMIISVGLIGPDVVPLKARLPEG
ncbi:MAG: DUF502 domain-containing protein [Elusimicrobia bacterium]|nr:DUF502 domain-containing protein [Elusimicrobiota bacterium]